MDPEAYFDGNTLTVNWQPVPRSYNYSLSVEQCSDQEAVCSQIFHTLVHDASSLSHTSDYFAPCTFYNIRLVALSSGGQRLLKETAQVAKSPRECDQALQLVLYAVLSAAGLALVVCLGLLLYYHKRRPIHRIQRVRSKVYSRLYSRDRYVRPVLKRDFVDVVEGMLGKEEDADAGAALAAEFQELEQIANVTIQKRTSCAFQPVNRGRCRYKDVVPFDSSRVRLQKPVKLAGEPIASDFVNASYISNWAGADPASSFYADGGVGVGVGGVGAESASAGLVRQMSANSTKRGAAAAASAASAAAAESGPACSAMYIAAQGPNEETSALFWELIWQQGVRVIVMLTNLVEGFGYNSVKCSLYWPVTVGAVRRHGALQVQLYDVQEAPDYTVRRMDLSSKAGGGGGGGGGGVSRDIVQIQYTSWPDRSAPSEAQAILQLIEVTRALSNQYDSTGKAPWLVHCSAGIGRTGTFIAVDQLLRMADNRHVRHLDVFSLIYHLRKERRYMVQTAGQYAYVYKCVQHYLRKKRQQQQQEEAEAEAEAKAEEENGRKGEEEEEHGWKGEEDAA